MPPLSIPNKIGIAIIASIAVLAVVAVYYFGDAVFGDGLDRFGCLKDRRVGHTLVLVDKTDPFSYPQKRILEDLMDQFKEERHLLGIYDKLSIYVLNESDFVRPKATFVACRPKSGEEADIWSETPAFLKANFDRKYAKPLAKLTSDLLAGEKSKHTPLLEMLREISQLSDFSERYEYRRLIIFSDMIQNTRDFSMYNYARVSSNIGKLSFSDVSKKYEQYFRRMAPRFGKNISVSMYLLRRQGGKTSLPWHVVQKFWIDYFSAHKVNLDPSRPCGPQSYSEGCIYVEP